MTCTYPRSSLVVSLASGVMRTTIAPAPRTKGTGGPFRLTRTRAARQLGLSCCATSRETWEWIVIAAVAEAWFLPSWRREQCARGDRRAPARALRQRVRGAAGRASRGRPPGRRRTEPPWPRNAPRNEQAGANGDVRKAMLDFPTMFETPTIRSRRAPGAGRGARAAGLKDGERSGRHCSAGPRDAKALGN
jgi:hypothetical protein